MGHGASTTVKKLTISQAAESSDGSPKKSTQSGTVMTAGEGNASAKLGWTRANSDGCIVENLNTSKTKTELLEQQVDEYKELFHHAEQKADEAQAKAETLEQQMAEVEGANFELLDQVSALEQQLAESEDQISSEAEREFSQILLERDQIIEKQEQQIKSFEEDLGKMRIKVKKKLRSAQTKLAEAKQEAGLKMYSLKDQIAGLQEENTKLLERLDKAHAVCSAQSRQSNATVTTSSSCIPKDAHMEEEEEWEDGRTKLILELSSQLSAQEQRICELEEMAREKDQMIHALQTQLRANPRPPSGSQRKQNSTNLHSRSAEKRVEPSQGNSSKGWTTDDDNESSIRRRRTSSSSKAREGHRSSSAGRQASSGKQRQMTDHPTDDDTDNLTNHESAIRSADHRKTRQLSANSIDSAISDRSDLGSVKASSASSSRQRRRLRNQLSRQSSSADEKELPTGMTEVQSEARVEGRDSGIGVTSDIKSKYSDDMDQVTNDIIIS